MIALFRFLLLLEKLHSSWYESPFLHKVVCNVFWAGKFDRDLLIFIMWKNQRNLWDEWLERTSLSFNTQTANFFHGIYNQTSRSAASFSQINLKTVHLDEHGILPHLRCKLPVTGNLCNNCLLRAFCSHRDLLLDQVIGHHMLLEHQIVE